MEFVRELNTNLGNSTSFLAITYTTLSTKWFRKYIILMIHVAAVFCFWTEQRWNGSSIFKLGFNKTPKVQNTVSEDNSLSFPMVHQTAPTG
jgi:hypothetical protein